MDNKIKVYRKKHQRCIYCKYLVKSVSRMLNNDQLGFCYGYGNYTRYKCKVSGKEKQIHSIPFGAMKGCFCNYFELNEEEE